MAFYVGKTARTIRDLVQPSVAALAARLFVLSAGRPGSSKFKPTVATFYETGIVTSLYEHLLMSPVFTHLEIRHEMPYHSPGVGAPERVDIWMRPPDGGYPNLIEAGDYGVDKIHRDMRKMQRLNPNGSNWFLCFIREGPGAEDPWAKVSTSLGRQNGLDGNLVQYDARLAIQFNVYSPDGSHHPFGAALLRAVRPAQTTP